MLGTFLKMMDSYTVDPNFDGNEYGDVIETAHAIKGASGNLSITPIYEAYGEIVNLLRKQQPEEAREILVGVLPLQEKIINAIKNNI